MRLSWVLELGRPRAVLSEAVPATAREATREVDAPVPAAAPPPARGPSRGETPEQRLRRRRRRRRARLHRLLLLIAALLIALGLGVPSGVVYYACFTEQGTQLIASFVPHRMGDDKDILVEIHGIKGTLAHGLTIDRVDVDERLVHVRVEGLRGHVALGSLLWQTVRSRDAFARRVTVWVKKDPPPARTHTPPSFLPRWLVVSLDRARIADGAILLPNGVPLNFKDFVSTAVLHHSSIKFFDAQLQHDDQHISTIGTLRAAEPMKMDLDLRMHWTPEDQADWLFAATFKGDLNSAAMNVHTLAPFRSDFSGRMLSMTNLDRWRWLGNAVVKDLDLNAWHAAGPLGIIDGQLHLQGDRHGFVAQGTATPQGLHAGLFDVRYQGWYQDKVLTAERIDLRHRTSGARAIAHGTIGIVPHGPELDLQGSWADFRWPLVGPDIPFHSSAADFTIAGIIPFRVTARGMGQAVTLPSWPMRVAGSLGKDGFKLTSGAVDLYGGHARLTGEVGWADNTQTWSIDGDLADVSLGEIRPDLPGHVSFALSARGDSFAATQDLDIDVRDLAGTVRGQAARGSGHLTRTEGSWTFDNLHANLGKTRLELDGVVAQAMALRFLVQTEDLSLISPDSRGLLRATGYLRGTPDMPVVEAQVQGTGILHHGIAVEDLDAKIDFDPHPQRESSIAIRLRNLRHNKRTIASFTLGMTGRPDRYALRTQVEADGLSASASANGSFSHGQLTGQLDALNILSRDSLRLTLDKPVELRLSREHARIERLCVAGKPASLCAEGDWTPGQWSTTLTASELPIESLTSGLPGQAVKYEGTVKVLARLWGLDGEPVQGTVQADLTNAQLVHTLLSRRVEHTAIGSGTIQVNAGKTTIDASASLQDGQIGTLHATATVQRGAREWQEMPVQAQLQAQTSQLDLLSLYLPDIDRASGHLTADANISGTLGAPRLAGQLRVADAEVDLYQVNLRLRDLQFGAMLTDTGIDFNGRSRIGNGFSNAAGRLEWRDALPYGQISLQGNDLRVVDIPEAHIDASPDLRFKIAGRRIEVEGIVDVPYARIIPRDLSTAVRTSSDEVIVGTEQENPAKRMEVLSSINLRLGDKVNIITSGLTARLTGNLAVKSGYEATTRATGQLSVAEGKYVAYAHNFDIQSGTLIFTGGPVDNPGIDIKAARKFPDVSAGVKVRGTLQQPRMSFFSEPSLPQSEIVSLILSGGSLESAQSRDRSAGAGNEALVQGGAILLQQLGSQVGIEDVGVQSDRYNTNDTSLVLGKYLSPRLYVSYGVGLTEQLQVLKLRYSLGDHWTVKTEMGQARGADLEFSIDR